MNYKPFIRSNSLAALFIEPEAGWEAVADGDIKQLELIPDSSIASEFSIIFVNDASYGNYIWNGGYVYNTAGGNKGHIYNKELDSLAEGTNEELGDLNTASGIRSHAEGIGTEASGQGSHAEGYGTSAYSNYSHAEGRNTIAYGDYSHAEGWSTTAQGQYSQSIGEYTTASGEASHAEGYESDATNSYAHAEGYYTTASGQSSHAEGNTTTALGQASHAEGTGGNVTLFQVRWERPYGNKLYYNSISSSRSASDSALNFLAGSDFASDAWLYNSASDITEKYRIEKNNKFAGWIRRTLYNADGSVLGVITRFPDKSQGEDGNWFIIDRDAQIPSGTYVSAYIKTGAAGESSHSEGYLSDAAGKYSHAEGERTRVTGTAAHGEGTKTQAYGAYSHAEGEQTQALAFGSHSEGKYTHAEGEYTHVEGYDTKASGLYAHSEGIHSSAQGEGSHAEGYNCTTDGNTTYKETKHKVILNSISNQTISLRYISEGNQSKFENYFNTLRTIQLKNPNNKPEKIYLKNCVVDYTNGEYIYLKLNPDVRQGASVIDYDYGYSIGATYNVLKEVTTVAAHAEGKDTVAAQTASHSEGINTRADGDATHAEGINSKALSKYAHAEGVNTFISEYSEGSHTEGFETQVNSIYSHAEGWKTFVQSREEFVNRNAKVKILSYNSTTHHIVLKLVEGDFNSLRHTFDKRKQSSVQLKPIAYEGEQKIKLHNFIEYSTNDSNFTIELTPRYDIWGEKEKENQSGIKGDVSYNISDYPNAIFQVGRNEYFGFGAHAEGGETYTEGTYSHAEGEHTKALSQSAHAEGYSTTASGEYSHAEGYSTTASGYGAHAEGKNTEASGEYGYSHAEGENTTAYGQASHAEGVDTIASEDYSHAEGENTTASGQSSHAEGYKTETKNRAEHAQGFRNVSHKASNEYGNKRNTLFSVGAGGNYIEVYKGEPEFIGYFKRTIDWDDPIQWQYYSGSDKTVPLEYCLITERHEMPTPDIADIENLVGSQLFSDDEKKEYLGTVIAAARYDQSEPEKASARIYLALDKYVDVEYDAYNAFSCWRVEKSDETEFIYTGGEDRSNALEITQNGDIYVRGAGNFNGDNISEAQTLQQVLKNLDPSNLSPLFETISAALNNLNDRLTALDTVVSATLVNHENRLQNLETTYEIPEP